MGSSVIWEVLTVKPQLLSVERSQFRWFKNLSRISLRCLSSTMLQTYPNSTRTQSRAGHSGLSLLTGRTHQYHPGRRRWTGRGMMQLCLDCYCLDLVQWYMRMDGTSLLYDTLKCHGHRTFCVFEFELPGLYMWAWFLFYCYIWVWSLSFVLLYFCFGYFFPGRKICLCLVHWLLYFSFPIIAILVMIFSFAISCLGYYLDFC